jgi:hypothetical protein
VCSIEPGESPGFFHSNAAAKYFSDFYTYANQQLMYEGFGFDEELADAIESRVRQKAPHEWEKYPDAPLGEVVARLQFPGCRRDAR